MRGEWVGWSRSSVLDDAADKLRPTMFHVESSGLDSHSIESILWGSLSLSLNEQRFSGEWENEKSPNLPR